MPNALGSGPLAILEQSLATKMAFMMAPVSLTSAVTEYYSSSVSLRANQFGKNLIPLFVSGETFSSQSRYSQFFFRSSAGTVII